MEADKIVTESQKLARKYLAGMADEVMSTIKWLRWMLDTILIGALTVSYTHQVDYLRSEGMGLIGAIIIPIALDALTVACVKVLATRAIVRVGKFVAGAVLIVPIVSSSLINFAGPGTQTVKLAYVLSVVLIPLAEIVRAFAKANYKVMDQMEREAHAEVPVIVEKDARKRCEPGCACGRHNRKPASKPATRKPGRPRKVAVAEVAELPLAM